MYDLHVYRHTCMFLCARGDSRMMLEANLHCSSILFSEARSLNQPRTHSSLEESSIIGITYAYLKTE